ncbi:hypothetical protein FPV67DRAFT_1407179 [Lyophyllum atratum]|nr:hypothetical protein FPV67DRAFT_1407179 [Lyophyllum atratum]
MTGPHQGPTYILPPGYTFPQRFDVGQKQIPGPLVNSAQIKGHLALLHAFTALRAKIEDFDGSSQPAVPFMPRTRDERWVWFVGFAVERFRIWCESLTLEDSKKPAAEFLPPLDVLMVWHAYMLNPGWYAEDCTRLPTLKNLAQAGHLFTSYLSSGAQEILAFESTKTREDFWRSRTRRPFDALEDAHMNRTKTIKCPKCRKALQIPYLNSWGTGYLQQDFRFDCSSCSGPMPTAITLDTLGIRKFADDLVREDGGARTYLAYAPESILGSVWTPTTGIDLARGKHIKDQILKGDSFHRAPGSSQEEWVGSILLNSSKRWTDLANMRYAIPMQMREVDRILSAYTDDRPFSADLVGAVIRQGLFVKKMQDLQWIGFEVFDDEAGEVAIQHSVARYHAFLDLMAASPVSSYVPTLDIDFARHTHQLMGEQYNADCMTYVGRYIDHDDMNVPARQLLTSFDLTSRAWHTRFGVPYTHCGRPPPAKTIGQRLSRLLRFYQRKPSHLIPLKRPDLLAGTHASVHNSVLYHLYMNPIV